MADYCVIADVRERLPDIKTGAANAEITNCIEEAMSVIDDTLAKHVTVPLSVVPTQIKHICADMAASIFRSRRSPDGVMPALYERAAGKLEAYVKATYKKGTLVR